MKTALTIIVLFLTNFVSKAQTEWPDSIMAHSDQCENISCYAANFMFIENDKGSIEFFDDWDKVVDVSSTYERIADKDTSVIRLMWQLRTRNYEYNIIQYSNVPLNQFYPKKHGIGTIFIVSTYLPQKLSQKSTELIYQEAMTEYRERQRAMH